jgi:hypothetical protein
VRRFILLCRKPQRALCGAFVLALLLVPGPDRGVIGWKYYACLTPVIGLSRLAQAVLD